MNKTELTEAAGVQPVVFCCHAYEKKVQWTFFEWRNFRKDVVNL